MTLRNQRHQVKALHKRLCVIAACLHQAHGRPCISVIEVELSKASDAQFGGIFLDPSGHHVLVNLRVSGISELHYLHSKWKKPRLLSKVKGTDVTAIAWHPKDTNAVSTG